MKFKALVRALGQTKLEIVELEAKSATEASDILYAKDFALIDGHISVAEEFNVEIFDWEEEVKTSIKNSTAKKLNTEVQLSNYRFYKHFDNVWLVDCETEKCKYELKVIIHSYRSISITECNEVK